MKGAVERATWRGLQKRKVRRAKRELERQRRLAMAARRGLGSAAFLQRPISRHAELPEMATSRSPISTKGEGEPILLIHGFASNRKVNWVYPGWVSTLNAARAPRDRARQSRAWRTRPSSTIRPTITPSKMAEDALALLDHLKIERADVIGYSMGARITAFLAATHPDRVRSAILGGLGYRLVDGAGLPEEHRRRARGAVARRCDRSAWARTFRAFADQTKSDRRALAACIRGSASGDAGRARSRRSTMPVLIAVGTKDDVAGSGRQAGGADAACAGARHSRAAITCLRSATRCSRTACCNS